MELVRDRFALVEGDPMEGGAGETLVVDDLDQAALRALLLLLWDAGTEVVSVTQTTPVTPPAAGDRARPAAAVVTDSPPWPPTK